MSLSRLSRAGRQLARPFCFVHRNRPQRFVGLRTQAGDATVAGRREVDTLGIAARVTDITGATVIASIDVTDQSMGRGSSFRNHEYSRRTWVRFIAQQTPERLNTRVIDALTFLNLTEPQPESPAVASAPQPETSAFADAN